MHKLTIYKEVIVDATTGEVTKIEFTPEELKAYNAELKKREEEFAALKAEHEAQVATRLSALEKLSVLGLTEDEIKAIAT